MTEAVPTFYDTLAQWSEIVGGFAFIIVAVILFRKYVLPAVRSGQIARNADLVNAEGHRETLKAEAVRARAELENADRDASAIVQRAAADGTRERERLVTEARADSERTIANAGGELARARLAAQNQLRIEFVERALKIARAKADSRVDGATNARLVGATVATLLGASSEGSA